MLIPPNRHSRAIMADSLLPKDRKKQLTQEMTLEPAGGGKKRGRKRAKRKKTKSYLSYKTLNDAFVSSEIPHNRGVERRGNVGKGLFYGFIYDSLF